MLEKTSPIIESKYMPIKALNQYSRDWVVQAKLARKNEMRQLVSNGSVVLKIEIIDQIGTTIECTFFGETAHEFNKRLEVDKVYLFSNGQVKLTNRKYSTIPNDYCIVFESNACIIESNDHIEIEE